MHRQVGLLIMKDENDILDEYLRHITQYFEKIYVLDGSTTPEGKDICSKYAEVVWYKTDDEIVKDGIKKDGIRGYVWDAIRADPANVKYTWVGVLHPDEFWIGDVLAELDAIHRMHPSVDMINVESMHGFLHISQKDTWSFNSSMDSIFEKTKWAMVPGHIEERIFKFNTSFYYQYELHSKTTPVNCHRAYVTHKLKLLQCTYRTKEQVMSRIESRVGWQPNDFIRAAYHKDIFFNTLTSTKEERAAYPHARSFYDNGVARAQNIEHLK